MLCGLPPSDLTRNTDINDRGLLTWVCDADPSSFAAEIGQYFVGRRSWYCVIWRHPCSYLYIKQHTLQRYLIETSTRRCSCIIIVDESSVIAQSGKLGVPGDMVSLRQANVGNDMKKYSLPSIFTFYLDGDTSVLELFSCCYISIKGILNAVGVDTFISIETV